MMIDVGFKITSKDARASRGNRNFNILPAFEF